MATNSYVKYRYLSTRPIYLNEEHVDSVGDGTSLVFPSADGRVVLKTLSGVGLTIDDSAGDEIVLTAAPVAASIQTETLSGATHTTDLVSNASVITEIDASGETATTLTISNPVTGGIYTFRFHSVTTLDITWPANVYDETETAFGTTSHADDVMYTFYYNGTNFYSKST